MQKIYTNQTLIQVTHIKNLLDAANISSVICNEYAAGGVGELSFVDTWPELWVAYEDVALSKKLIDDHLASSEGEDWRCFCGELNGAAFLSCWSCHRNRPQ